jgi:hypothetical protein
MKLRIRHLNRQSPRDRFGWLCVTNNGDGSRRPLTEVYPTLGKTHEPSLRLATLARRSLTI